MIRRREFIALLGGAAASPLAARAQQPERVRRIGVLMSVAANDPEGQARLAAFLHGLQQLGWIDGRNVRIDTRWGAGSTEEIRKHVAELVALTPDVILASGGSTAGPLLQATRTLRSSSRRPLIRLAQATLRVWRTRAATPPVLRCPNMASARSCWRCSNRSRQTSRERRSFATPPYSKESACGALSRQRHHHSGSRSALSTRASAASSNAPSQHSRASRTAA
jgi:hypothetical protein